MSWYDTMVIPKGSPNAYAAADLMNFVYDPVQAAQLTAYVQYVSPVKGVREELIKMGGDAAALADSPILFPTDRGRRPAQGVRRPARRGRRRHHRPLPRDHGRLTVAAADTGRPQPCAAGAGSRTCC